MALMPTSSPDLCHKYCIQYSYVRYYSEIALLYSSFKLMCRFSARVISPSSARPMRNCIISLTLKINADYVVIMALKAARTSRKVCRWRQWVIKRWFYKTFVPSRLRSITNEGKASVAITFNLLTFEIGYGKAILKQATLLCFNLYFTNLNMRKWT